MPSIRLAQQRVLAHSLMIPGGLDADEQLRLSPIFTTLAELLKQLPSFRVAGFATSVDPLIYVTQFSWYFLYKIF